MTPGLRWESGGTGQTVGYVQFFTMLSPPTGSAYQVSVSASGGTGFSGLSGGSLSFFGAGSISAGSHGDSAGANSASGTITIPTTSAANMVAAFATNGSGNASFTAGTSRFVTTDFGAGAAVQCAGATLPLLVLTS